MGDPKVGPITFRDNVSTKATVVEKKEANITFRTFNVFAWRGVLILRHQFTKVDA
jgi:hypothetical protein